MQTHLAKRCIPSFLAIRPTTWQSPLNIFAGAQKIIATPLVRKTKIVCDPQKFPTLLLIFIENTKNISSTLHASCDVTGELFAGRLWMAGCRTCHPYAHRCSRTWIKHLPNIQTDRIQLNICFFLIEVPAARSQWDYGIPN